MSIYTPNLPQDLGTTASPTFVTLNASTSVVAPVVTASTSVGTATVNASVAVITAALQADTITNDTGLAAGTYTPTLTNVANLSLSGAYECQYMRVGNTVTVSGKVDADAVTAGVATQLGISLPIASNIGTQQDCAGTGFAPLSTDSPGSAIFGDATNDRAQMQWIAGDLANLSYYFTFSYQVI